MIPQKNSCPNAVCASNLVFYFFNLFTTINRKYNLFYINALHHPPVPSLREGKKKASLKSLSNFGCSDRWLVTVTAGGQEWRTLCQAEHTGLYGSVAHVLPGWLIPLKASVREHWCDSGFSPEPGVAECSHSLPSPHVSGSQLLPQTEI